MCRLSAGAASALLGLHTEPDVVNGKATQMDFCMEMFQAPNQRGARAIVMKTLSEASKWCESKSKRICSEFEWETACESGEELPWFYGWSADRTICNGTNRGSNSDVAKLASNGASAKTEADRLWQGTPSGAVTTCQTRDGIYDLLGNVEEWVSSSRKRKFAGALMGGFWAKPWTGCRGTNDAHEPNFGSTKSVFAVAARPTAMLLKSREDAAR